MRADVRDLAARLLAPARAQVRALRVPDRLDRARASASPPRRAAPSAGSRRRSSTSSRPSSARCCSCSRSAGFVVDRLRGDRQPPDDGAGHAARADPDDARDGAARPRHVARLRRRHARAAVRRPARRGATSPRSALLGAVAIALALVALPAVGVEVLKPYQVDRLTSFLHPSEAAGEEGYQQQQSKIAIGSGEKTGRGVENATQTEPGLPARAPHRLHLRGGRRDLRVRRRRAGAIALRAA